MAQNLTRIGGALSGRLARQRKGRGRVRRVVVRHEAAVRCLEREVVGDGQIAGPLRPGQGGLILVHRAVGVEQVARVALVHPAAVIPRDGVGGVCHPYVAARLRQRRAKRNDARARVERAAREVVDAGALSVSPNARDRRNRHGGNAHTARQRRLRPLERADVERIIRVALRAGIDVDEARGKVVAVRVCDQIGPQRRRVRRPVRGRDGTSAEQRPRLSGNRGAVIPGDNVVDRGGRIHELAFDAVGVYLGVAPVVPELEPVAADAGREDGALQGGRPEHIGLALGIVHIRRVRVLALHAGANGLTRGQLDDDVRLRRPLPVRVLVDDSVNEVRAVRPAGGGDARAQKLRLVVDIRPGAVVVVVGEVVLAGHISVIVPAMASIIRRSIEPAAIRAHGEAHRPESGIGFEVVGVRPRRKGRLVLEGQPRGVVGRRRVCLDRRHRVADVLRGRVHRGVVAVEGRLGGGLVIDEDLDVLRRPPDLRVRVERLPDNLEGELGGSSPHRCRHHRPGQVETGRHARRHRRLDGVDAIEVRRNSAEEIAVANVAIGILPERNARKHGMHDRVLGCVVFVPGA